MVNNDSGSRLFISYSRKNKEPVYALADAMAKAGIEIWIDREEIDPLDDFPARIRDGLARSHALLAWYSPEYAQSSFCQKELTAAWICTQRLTRDVLSRILIVNPEEGVAHIALGDIGRQNYLAAPIDAASLDQLIQSIRNKLVVLSGDFAALHKFKVPDWHPSPQPGSSRFVGRLWELWRIHTAHNPVGISDHENPSVLVQITGLGGIGKSLLAIEYAKRFGAAYPGGIYWLRAYGFDPQKPMDYEAQERERQGQIENFALHHGIPIGDKKFNEVYLVLSQKLAAGEPYLWIVDDLSPGLDQQQGFPDWCAPSGNGHTFITTRSKEYAGLGNMVEIDVLDPKAALELLTQERKPNNEQERRDAANLTEDLGRHALALDVAGHFLLKTQGFAALRAKLAKAESDLLGEFVVSLIGQLPGGHEKSIVVTLLQSVRLLNEEGLNLLRLAGELRGDTQIPFRLANKTFFRAFGLDEQAAWDYVTRAVNQLDTHSLATAFGDGFLVHALVRYTLLHGDPAQEKAPLLRQLLRNGALLALIDLLPGVEDIRKHASLELEVSHARHLTLEPRTHLEARLGAWLARYAGERGNYHEAMTLAWKGLPIFTQEFGADHPDTINIRGHIARWTGETGEVREALRLYQELLPVQTRVLGADHPDVLTNRANIAWYTGKNGEAREALRLSRELLPDQTRVLGADHHVTLTNRNNIAAWIGQTGEAHEALRLCRELLPDQTRVLGADHRDTFRTRADIAHWTGQAGDPQEALRLLRELLPDETRVLGADHPDTLSNRNNLAGWTGETGDPREALRLLKELLPVRIRVLGADHPDTLITRNNLAHWTGQTGDPHEALRLFRELLPDRTRVLGADHPDTLGTRAHIAAWIGVTGEAHEALRLFRELLPDQTRVLGADHPDTLNNRANIANWTGHSGDAHEALRLFRELLPDQTRVLGADHPDTLTNRANIAYWTGQSGDAHEALRLYQELLPDQTRGLGADHPDTLTNRANIAYWTGQTGEAHEALRLCRELLPDQTRVLGADHRDTIQTQEWISTLQRQQRSWIGWFRRILFGDHE